MQGTIARGNYNYNPPTTMSQAECVAFRDWLATTYPGLTPLATTYNSYDNGTGGQEIWARAAYRGGRYLTIWADTQRKEVEIVIRLRRSSDVVGMTGSLNALREKLIAHFNLSPIPDQVPWHTDLTQDGENISWL